MGKLEWGYLFIGIGVGSMLAFSSRLIGIPLSVIIAILGIILVIQGYRQAKGMSQKVKEQLINLSHLRIEGAAVLNRGLVEAKSDTTQADNWRQEVEKWIKEVKSIMSKIHPADADNWDILGTFQPKYFGSSYDAKINHELTMLSVRLEKLGQYINDRTQS